MNPFTRFWRCVSPALAFAMVCASLVLPSAPALAAGATTGTITGTVTNAATGAPIPDARVSAVSPSGSLTSVTDSKGFYVLQNLLPDTYTLSVSKDGFQSESFPGLTVVQDLSIRQDMHLAASLKTIATVKTRAGGSLVRPDTTSDSYTVTGAQLEALSLGNDLHKTLYQYTAMIPGITGNGYGSEPTVHGGSLADVSYEFDGVPIDDEMTGFFTTNLSNGGIGSILVSTGGLNASQSASGIGFINTVVKAGTYPGFATATISGTPQYRNAYEEFEYGGATPNQKFSWYFSVDETNALNEFSSGLTYPLQLIEQANGPGKITTSDIVANFHFRPTEKDDIQFLVQNGLGEFGFGYLMARAPGEPPPLSVNQCAGAAPYTTADLGANQSGVGSSKYNNVGTATNPVFVYNNSYTGGYGGTAPDGSYCPEGLYWGTASTQNNGGNFWHHYSGIGKLQWNHIINEHSSLNLRVSENFNQYIFDQPIADANLPQYENNGAVNVAGNCPAYPYVPGTPVAQGTNYTYDPGTGHYDWPYDTACMQLANWVSTGYYEDRNSRIWSEDLTYDNTINANSDIELGVGNQYSPDTDNIYFTGWFTPPGEYNFDYPASNFSSTYPIHTWYAYAQGDFRYHKFLFSPGLRFTSRHYSYPIAGGATGKALNPTFAINSAAGRSDVIIGSFTDSVSLVPGNSVYRNTPPSMLNGPSEGGFYCSPQDTQTCGTSPTPTLTHSYNLMWEHQINANTSFKIGPYADYASNILINYVPMYLNTTKTPPVFQPVPATAKGVLSNIGVRKSFGVEFGLSHNDTRDTGVSYWLAGTFDNFWTNISSSLLTPFGNYSPAPQPNVLQRSGYDPPLSGSVTFDFHKGGLHFIPQWYLQSSYPYYAYYYFNSDGTVASQELHTAGYGDLNGTLKVDIGPKRDWTVGVQGMNILNNNRPLTSCYAYGGPDNGWQGSNLGVGCYGMQPAGTNSIEPGTADDQDSFPTEGVSTPLFFFFISKKF